MTDINHQIKLAARPVGLPKESDWERADSPIPTPGPGEVLTKIHYMSVDPAMRGWMNDRPSYVPPVQIGEVMRALTVAEVIESNNDGFAPGEFVAGIQGVQEYALSDGKDLMKADISMAPAPAWLNTLGIAGLTAYCGLIEVGQPKEGETVVVSGAAGSVGAHAGQIAKIKGCRVVGSPAGPKNARISPTNSASSPPRWGTIRRSRRSSWSPTTSDFAPRSLRCASRRSPNRCSRRSMLPATARSRWPRRPAATSYGSS